MTVGKTFL